MSSIGVMFAPHHQAAADELVRVCRPGGTIGLLSWTPEGMIGALFRTMGPFAPPPPPGAQPPPLWGSEEHLARAVRRPRRARARSSATCSRSPRSRARTTTASTSRRATARRSPRAGNAAQATAARPSSTPRSTRFCDEWNRGTRGRARGSRWSTCSRRHARLGELAESPRRSAAAAASRREATPSLRQHRRDVVVDGLGRDHERLRRSPRWWRPRAIRSSTSVWRGVSPAGPGARRRRAGRAGSARTPAARRRRRRRGRGARGAERRRRRRSASSRAASSSASASASARSYGKPSAAQARGRAAPVAGDRARVRLAGRRRAPATGAPARHSQQASSPRAHASPRALGQRRRRRARGRGDARRGRRRATRARRAPPRRGASRCSSPVATATRHASSSVAPRLRVAAPRLQPAEHDERRAEADAGLLAERRATRARRPRPPPTRRVSSRRSARAPSRYWT